MQPYRTYSGQTGNPQVESRTTGDEDGHKEVTLPKQTASDHGHFASTDAECKYSRFNRDVVSPTEVRVSLLANADDGVPEARSKRISARRGPYAGVYLTDSSRKGTAAKYVVPNRM